MAMEDIKSMLDGMDITALIPSLEDILSKLDLLLRILVMAGPLALLGLGLYYFLAPPKEANHEAGYRFRYGMSKVKVWQFTQRMAGIVYSSVGFVLTVIMSLICSGFGAMEAPDMVWAACKCILWQVGLILVGTIAINVTVVAAYDRKGNRRGSTKEE